MQIGVEVAEESEGDEGSSRSGVEQNENYGVADHDTSHLQTTLGPRVVWRWEVSW